MAREQKVVVVGVVKCLGDTQKAIRVVSSTGGMTTPGDTEPAREQWVPRKAIDTSSEVHKEGDTGTLVVYEWFALINKWPGFEQGMPERPASPYAATQATGGRPAGTPELERRVMTLERELRTLAERLNDALGVVGR